MIINTKYIRMFLLTLPCFLNLSARSYTKVTIDTKILINSIPKSGTHLAQKCIELLTGKIERWIGTPKTNLFYTGNDYTQILYKLSKLDAEHYIFSHLTYGKELDILLTSKHYRVFFIYRDPRSQVVSLAKWWTKIGHNIDNDFSKTLLSLIQDDRLYKYRWKNVKNIKDLYLEFMPWALNRKFFAIKFEDLVGERGGGSAIKQYDTVYKIAKYLALKRTAQDIQFVCNQLFGGTITFNQGQIDSWKTYFNEEHKNAFKKIAGNLLIELGYEKNNNW